jgi:glycerol-3-phosphate O-acyltransferase / dihydroxyacetone phosphate acyltransferase
VSFSSDASDSLSDQDHPELLKPINYANIRQLTENMRQQISRGTMDTPSWDILRSAKCAANIYAPLGTRMSLGDYVRLVKAYIDVFALTHVPAPQGEDEGKEGSSLREENKIIMRLYANLKVHRIYGSFLCIA